MIAAFAALLMSVFFTVQSSDLPDISAQAAAAWSRQTVLEGSLGSCSGSACITVVLEQATECSEFGDGVLGCAALQSDGSCLVQIDPLLLSYGDKTVLAVVEHEMGHCLGIWQHTTQRNSIMNAHIDLGDPPKGPSAYDRKLINSIYSQSP